jgi:methyl-accepting chemotaxis protein
VLGDLKGFLSDTLSKAAETNAAQVAEVKNTVESFSKSVEARIVDLAEQHNNLSETVKGIRETIGSVEKRIDAVEGETAIKKSADLGGSTEFVKKSKWSGAFLGSVNDILN